MPRPELTWNDAIERVLRERGEPMHYMDITEAIVRDGLRQNLGATPSYTVAAQFSMDKQKGEQSRFLWVSRSTYGLRDWTHSSPQARDTEESAEASPTAALTELAIQAYGMYWDRERVDWSRSNPRMLGQQFQKTVPIDFAEQRGLYVLYDDRAVVYIGRATQLGIGARLGAHTVDRLRTRWNRFSWFGFWGVREDGKLLESREASANLESIIAQLETVLIEVIEPPQNRQQGKGFVGIEYLQAEDPSLKQKKHMELVALLASKLAPEDN